jgi:membrane associated rhomboid family serine protease
MKPATMLLVVLLVSVYAVEGARGAIGDEIALLRMGALPNDGALHGEWWRLLTYSLLHLDLVHIGLNTALLWWVGSVVERRIPRGAFAAVYVGAALAAGGVITVLRAAHPKPGSSLGASGAILGLVGCALVLTHRADAARFGQARAVRLALWAIVVVSLGASLVQGVSLAGHAAGLIAGVLAGFLVPVRADAPA